MFQIKIQTHKKDLKKMLKYSSDEEYRSLSARVVLQSNPNYDTGKHDIEHIHQIACEASSMFVYDNDQNDHEIEICLDFDEASELFAHLRDLMEDYDLDRRTAQNATKAHQAGWSKLENFDGWEAMLSNLKKHDE